MDTMDTTPLCPGCGKPLPPSAPKGLCAACLFKAGFPTGTEARTGQSETPRSPAFVPPTINELAAKFPQLEILDLIGSGGMGAVYKARQKQLDRLVALKILPPGVGDAPAFAERFAREARALARLNHPGIVTLYEFGQTAGLFFFLMEFVDGVNLRQLLNAGRVAPREALAIVPQICDALQYAHDQGIVHRDIKPENILLDRRGRVKVADFGIAKLIGTEVAVADGAGEAEVWAGNLTDSGTTIGTPRYMAPEQKDRPLEVDHRADIYSLGVVLYQMLTGELPGQKIEPPAKRFHLDVRLDEVVLRALEKAPGRRYQQASEFKTQVETIAATSDSTAKISGARGGASPPDPAQFAAWEKRAPGCASAAANVELWSIGAGLAFGLERSEKNMCSGLVGLAAALAGKSWKKARSPLLCLLLLAFHVAPLAMLR
jgi:serine/threonine protein kinase